MMYLLHGATLMLVWFIAMNVAASCAVAAIAMRTTRVESAACWFVLRVLPATAATMFVAAVFLPSYIRYEPRDTAEGFDVTLTIVASAAVVIVALSVARGVASWWRARRRLRMWMRSALPLAIDCGSLPAFAVDVDTPVMALAGVVRPRLLVTRGLIDALTPEELKASVAHEIGHRRSWDNLKRLAMRAAPDVLTFTAVARVIERRWVSAAEHIADGMGGDRRLAARCALASALVKVARLMPPDPSIAEPISTLVGGGEIASRVRRLLEDRVVAPERSGARRRALTGMVAAAVFMAAYGPLLQAVHGITELLVRTLP